MEGGQIDVAAKWRERDIGGWKGKCFSCANYGFGEGSKSHTHQYIRKIVWVCVFFSSPKFWEFRELMGFS
nr:hypothetical protein [uncultured organism]